MINKIKNIKPKVKDLLKSHPHLRDNDNALMANIWWSEMDSEGRSYATAFGFMDSFSQGMFTNPESIRRCRQKVQEQNPELRGTTYKERQKLSKEVKYEIGKI